MPTTSSNSQEPPLKRFADDVPRGSETRIHFFGHPAHAMLVPFPIAFLMSVFASDVAWWWLQDPFWARVSLWLSGAGAVSAVVAGLVGTGELLLVSEIRRRAAAWSHFVAAVMLIAIAVANWGLRLDDHAAHIVPWGMYLSGLGTLLVSLAGWLGGTLVFEYHVGTGLDDEPAEDSAPVKPTGKGEDAPPAGDDAGAGTRAGAA